MKTLRQRIKAEFGTHTRERNGLVCAPEALIESLIDVFDQWLADHYQVPGKGQHSDVARFSRAAVCRSLRDEARE